MEKFSVRMVDCGTLLWEGSARDPLDACRLTARLAGLAVGEFRRHEALAPSQGASYVNRLEVSVYRWPGTEEDDFVGTFVAPVEE